MAFDAYHKAVAQLLALRNIEIPWDHRSSRGLRDGLERTKQLLRKLGSPERRMRFVHVTGTSGKGTVTSLIHSMLAANGERVASYTSPHTTTFLERFHIGDRLIDPKKLTAAINHVLSAYEAHLRANRQPLTFFELSTCIALYAFAQENVTWCVMEVGVGGRWDSTNVIPSPAVAVVTNIDLDHMHILGNTRQKIAREKAGIIKRGCHVVVGEQRRQLRAIFAKEAENVGATIEYVRNEADDHRLHNALVATRAALAVNVPLPAIETALQQYHGLPCRLETMQEKPRVILDGAHNAAKIAATVARMGKKKVDVIVGCKSTKDAKQMIAALIPIAKSIRTTRCETGQGAAHSPFALLALVPKKLRAGAFLLPHNALNDALAQAKAGDCILVTGSLYLAGELRTHWVTEQQILRQRNSHRA